MRTKKTNGIEIKIPDEFICPISQQIMLDPVIIADGHVFERAMIEKWFKTKSTSPLTNLQLNHTNVTPVIFLKPKITEFLEQYPQFKSKQFSFMEHAMHSLDSFFQFTQQSENELAKMKEWLNKEGEYEDVLNEWLHKLAQQLCDKDDKINDIDCKKIRLLLQFGANCNQTIMKEKSEEVVEEIEIEPVPLLLPILFAIISLKGYALAMEMIEKWSCDISVKNSDNSTALHWVLHTSKEDQNNEELSQLVDLLIERMTKLEGNLNQQDEKGNTPLHLAIEKHWWKIAYLLLKYMADVSIVNKNGYDCCALLLSHIEKSKGQDQIEMLSMVEQIVLKGYIIQPRRANDNASAKNCLEMIRSIKKATLCHKVYQAIFFPTKYSQIISGGSDNQVKLWDMNLKKCIATFIDHTECVYCLIGITSTKKIISGSGDKTIKIWNIETQKCETTLQGHSSSVFCLVQLDSERIVSGSTDKTLKVWNMKTKQCDLTLQGHIDAVSCIIKLDEERIVSGSYDKTIRIWNITDGTCASIIQTNHSDCIACIALLNDEQIVSGSRDEKLKIWNIKSKECITTFHGHTNLINSVTKLNEKQIVSGSSDETIRIWNTETGGCEKIIKTDCSF